MASGRLFLRQLADTSYKLCTQEASSSVSSQLNVLLQRSSDHVRASKLVANFFPSASCSTLLPAISLQESLPSASFTTSLSSAPSSFSSSAAPLNSSPSSNSISTRPLNFSTFIASSTISPAASLQRTPVSRWSLPSSPSTQLVTAISSTGQGHLKCFSKTVDFPKDYGRNQSGRGLGWLVASAVNVCALSSLATAAEAKEKIAVSLPGEVVLYQYEACPFCNKLKAYLDYRDIPYRVVEVNPLNKKEIKWSDYKKVPVLVVDGEQFNDSTAIITSLETRFHSKPATTEGESEESRWRRWVDEHLVHMLSPNIYRSPSEAMQAFEYITTNGKFSGLERMMAKYAGATAMYFISKKLKKKYNIEDPRASLYAAAQEWVDALNGRNFLGGDKPNLADISVFGVLRPIRNLQTGVDMMAHTAIGPWYARMEAQVGDSARIQE